MTDKSFDDFRSTTSQVRFKLTDTTRTMLEGLLEDEDTTASLYVSNLIKEAYREKVLAQRPAPTCPKCRSTLMPTDNKDNGWCGNCQTYV